MGGKSNEIQLTIIDDIILNERYSEIQNIRNIGLNDNDLKVKYSKPIIDKYGEYFIVHPPLKKSMKMKSGSCYGNAHKKNRDNGYKYVEGIIRSKYTGIEISHAWNVDTNGKHFDFTITDTENYDYYGIIVPFDLRYEISSKTGKVWYCVLPYINI